MSRSNNSQGLKLNLKDLQDHLDKLQSRSENLSFYITAFEMDWSNIKAFLNGGQVLVPICLELLCISVFAKLEVLKRQALFIHYGVKSMKVHDLDKNALYVPDVSMNQVLNETKYYSSISIEFIASQFGILNGDTYESHELLFEEIRTQFQTSFSKVDRLLPAIIDDFKHILALKNALSQGRIYVLKYPFIHNLLSQFDK